MERLDYFGREIFIRFKGFKSHKTKYGMLLTLTIISIIVVRVSYLINDFVQGYNPTVLYQERQVKNPKKFDISPELFSMAFGIIAADYSYYTDQTVLTIESLIETKTQKYNEQTQKLEDIWNQQLFQMERCTKEHIIKSEELSGDFPYLEQHFCFPKNLPLHIEGEYHQESFAQIFIRIKRCRGPQCKDEQTIQQALKLFWGEVIFTDVYISPEYKENPFTKYVRDTYWEASDKFAKNLFMEFRNNQVESDYGFLYENIQTDVFPSFSQTNEMVTNSNDDIYSTFVLRFQKKKENLYKRTYRKFLSIISELGGLIQVLTTIGILLSYYYTQMHLNQELINNSFTFQEQAKKVHTNSNEHVINIPKIGIKAPSSQQQKQKTPHDRNAQDSIIENNQLINGQISKQLSNNKVKSPFNKPLSNPKNDQLLQKDQVLIEQQQQQQPEKGSPSSPIKQIINQYMHSNKESSQSIMQNEVSNSPYTQKIKNANYQSKKNVNQIEEVINSNSNSMKFSIFNYFASFFLRFGAFKRKKAIYDYSIQQLYHYLDVQWIINKLIEFDKLKRILLDDDQLLLFEYLPKPSICYSFKNNSVEFHDNQSFTMSKKSKNEIENIQKAIQSYQKISNKDNQFQVDERILNYIDPAYKEIFSEESYLSPQNIPQDSNLRLNEQTLKKKAEKQEENNKLEYDDIPQDCLVQADSDQLQIEDHLRQYSLTYKLSPYNSPIQQQQQQYFLKETQQEFKLNSDN